MKRILTLLLSAALTLSLAIPALAVQTEQETAAVWLKENGILSGDQNGNFEPILWPDPGGAGRNPDPALG